VTTNAGGMRTSGIELAADARPTDDLTLSFGLTWAKTEFLSFAIPCNDRYTNPSTTPGQCTFVNPQVPGLLQFNAAGYPLAYAPEIRFSLGATYTRPITDNEMLRVTANYRWQDGYYTIVADPNSIVPSYGLLGATLGFGAQDESWMVSIFARNLLDEYYVTGIFPTSLDAGTAGSTPLSTRGYSNTPSIDSRRTIGIKLDVKLQ
jgi:iron complex outermembrane receptor protein